MASRGEAFGWTNIESMAVGTPVIASAVGGILEIVEDGVSGFLFPRGDHVALAKKMESLLRNHGLRKKLGNNARIRFLERFELGKQVKDFADWLEANLR